MTPPSALLQQIRDMPRARRQRLETQVLRRHLPAYAAARLRGPEQEGGKFLIGRHHLEWGAAAQKHDRILSIAARDHGKSYFWDFAYPIWQVDLVRPGKPGAIFSATETQAKKHLKRIKQEFVGGGQNGKYGNPYLQHLLPLGKSNETYLEFANGSSIEAIGFDSSARGGHPYWVVCDDILKDDVMWSELQRERATEKYSSVIEPMPPPGGQIVAVGTPFHARDTYVHMERTAQYFTMRHPAILPSGEALWAERYDLEWLAKKRIRVGSEIRWAREYLCQPVSSATSLFPRALLEVPGCLQPYDLGVGADYWLSRGFKLYMGVDLAISSSAGADFFVIFVLAYDPATGERWIVDIIRLRGVDYQRQVDLIIKVARKYRVSLALVEGNQFQRVIPEMVLRESDVPVKAFYTSGSGTAKVTTESRGMGGHYSSNRNHLDHGVPGMRMLFENGKVRIPMAPATREHVEYFLSELEGFTWVGGRLHSVSAHDDTVMAFWMADRAIHFGNTTDLDFLGAVPDLGPSPAAPALDATLDDSDRAVDQALLEQYLGSLTGPFGGPSEGTDIGWGT